MALITLQLVIKFTLTHLFWGILGMLQKSWSPGTVLGCMLPSLIFRKRMTLSLGNNSGHICVVVLCHLLCSAWSSICMQFFWFRASIRLFNSMLDSNSETLRRVLKADSHLASFDSSCWSAQVSNVFNGMQSSAMFKQKMLRATQVPMQSSFAICVSDIWRYGGKLILHVLAQ